MSHYVISVLYLWVYGRYRGLNQNSINILTDLRKKTSKSRHGRTASLEKNIVIQIMQSQE